MEDRANSPTGFLDLPPEMVEHIILHSNFQDLFSLRLTCRDLAAKADHAFIRSSFVARQFNLSNAASMTVLLGISSTHRLAKSLKCIVLSLDELQAKYHDWMVPFHVFQGTSRDIRVQKREYRRAHQNLLKEQDTYCRQGQDLRDLVQVFRNFVEQDLAPCVWAPSTANVETLKRSNFPINSAGHRRLRDTLGYGSGMVRSRKQRPVENVWRAMSEAAFPITILDLGTIQQSLPLDILTPNRIPLDKLVNLSLAISPKSQDRKLETGRDSFNPKGTLSTLLPLAPNLTKLVLTLTEKGAPEDFHDDLLIDLCEAAKAAVVQNKYPLKLHVLRLDGFQIVVTAIEFIVKCLPFLLDLTVTNIPLWEEEFVALRDWAQNTMAFPDDGSLDLADLVTVEINEDWTRLTERYLGYQELF